MYRFYKHTRTYLGDDSSNSASRQPFAIPEASAVSLRTQETDIPSESIKRHIIQQEQVSYIESLKCVPFNTGTTKRDKNYAG